MINKGREMKSKVTPSTPTPKDLFAAPAANKLVELEQRANSGGQRSQQTINFLVSSTRSCTGHEIMSLEAINDDSILNILQYATPLASARLGLTSRKWKEKILCHNERLWKSFAIVRWGHCVPLGLSNHNGDANAINETHDLTINAITWYQYFRHRSSSWKRPAQISQLDLIQEHYADDPYRLLTACILCSRTSGGALIRKVVHDFLEKYPTPSAVIDGDISAMAKELHSLGLNRERVMKRFAEGFVKKWTHVTELRGCGAFAAASFAVFCRGEYKKVLRDKKADRNVKAYAAFAKRFCEHSGAVEGVECYAQDLQSKTREMKKKKKRSLPPKKRPLPVRRMTRNRKQRVV
ncbi:hypothetical protein ACHAXR_010363 [Thalassiosira sp. AJA248-18]